MPTARQTDDAGEPFPWSVGAATPLHSCAVLVPPGRSYNPGLVYDSDVEDWYQCACSLEQLQAIGGTDVCSALPEIDPSNLNYPSISVGDLAGFQEVTRKVTNVTGKKLQFTPKVEVPAGFKVNVVPKKLTVPAGKTAQFKVEITRTTAPLGQFAFGSVTWTTTDRSVSDVRSPIAVRPVALAAPKEVTVSGTAGSTDLTVTPGFTGTLGTDVDGLQASTVFELRPAAAAGVLDDYEFFEVAAGTRVTRIATYSDEVNAADIDVNVYRFTPPSSISLVGSSGNGDSTETVTLNNLAPGTYVVAVDNFSAEADVTAPVHVWNVGDTAEGNLSVAPASVDVAQGVAANLTASWTGLDAAKRYLGKVNFLESGNVAGSTLVTVNP